MNILKVTAVIFMIIFLPGWSLATDLGSVRISYMEGDVQVNGDDSSEWFGAALNMPLREGDRLWVPEGGKVELQFRDGTEVRLNERTSFDLVRMETDSLQAYVPSGQVYVNTSGVTLSASGPVALRHPQVVTKLSPDNNRAELTVKVFATNAGTAPVTGTLRGRAAAAAFQKDLALAANESREVVLSPSDFPQLALAKPRLWWPAQYGEPALHDLDLEIVIGGAVSDRAHAMFGIREFSSELTPSGRVRARTIVANSL